MAREFHSNGKLLITGEYAVLDGALALAIPTVYGQTLKVIENGTRKLTWKSIDHLGKTWFEWTFALDIPLSEEKQRLIDPTAKTLANLLAEAQKLNPLFLPSKGGFAIETHLDFPKEWGLGSSSTLINNIAQWAQIDAYQLLWNAFSGSGYDIACAQNDTPLLYRLNDGVPEVQPVLFDPLFKKELFFVYLNKKQDSREGIARYRGRTFDKVKLIADITSLSKNIVNAGTLSTYEAIVLEHEKLISLALGLPMVKEANFSDYKGSIKSLGAWGGDFILASGNDGTPGYFKQKGYNVIIPFSKMMLHK
ncbi:MAG: GYDIA family GHMP kinase [Flavobacteriaceae bacterium]